MKKGKTTKLNILKYAKILYGTVDSVNLQSIYLNIQTWIEPKDDDDSWDKVVMMLRRKIKSIIYETLNNELFNDRFIVDVDLRTSGINLKKRSFMNIEITLYLKSEIDYKSKKLKDELKKIIRKLHTNIFNKNYYFKFYLTKKTNLIKKDVELVIN